MVNKGLAPRPPSTSFRRRNDPWKSQHFVNHVLRTCVIYATQSLLTTIPGHVVNYVRYLGVNHDLGGRGFVGESAEIGAGA